MGRPDRHARTIEAFAAGDAAALARMPGDAAAALRGVVLAQRGGMGWDAAGDLISRALAGAPTDPDLTACLVGCATLRALALGAVPEAAHLTSRLRRQLRRLHHPRAVAMVHRMIHAVAVAQGDGAAIRAAARAGMAAAEESGDVWLEFAAKTVHAALSEEDPAEARRILPKIEAQAPAARRFGCEPEQLRDALDLLNGQPEPVLERRRRSATPPDLTTLEAMLLADRLDDAAALADAWAAEAKDPGSPAIRRDRLQRWAWLGKIHVALYRRRPAEVLPLAQEAASIWNEGGPLRDHLLQVVLHAELCLGGIVRARSLLNTLDPKRRRESLRMEWIRLLRAEGDESAAGALFAKLVAIGPPDRVLAKLKLAHELDGVAVARLWFAAGARVANEDPGPRVPGRSATDMHTEMEPATMVGNGPAMAAVRDQIVALAPLDQPVLITGETGTGKEVVARLIHRHGRGDGAPFVALNCAAIPDTLAEAELFGHRRGAFTGAEGDRDGLLISAGAGTVFLDEVNSMSLRLQGVLLRVLETGDFRPVGATATRRTRARFVVAANQELEPAIAAGTFRKDLYYRLQGFAIRLPPLRERPEDIPALVRHFLVQTGGGDRLDVAPDLLAAFAAHPWPGNVRELRSTIERLALLRGERRRFTSQDWPFGRTGLAVTTTTAPSPSTMAPPLPIPGPPRARERRRRLLALFTTIPHLYREDAVRELGMSPATANHDLAALAGAGLVRRVITSAHLRTSYFVRVDS